MDKQITGVFVDEMNDIEKAQQQQEAELHQKRLLTARVFLAQYGTITERRACKFQLDKMMMK